VKIGGIHANTVFLYSYFCKPISALPEITPPAHLPTATTPERLRPIEPSTGISFRVESAFFRPLQVR
jgi:hypothetical protein